MSIFILSPLMEMQLITFAIITTNHHYKSRPVSRKESETISKDQTLPESFFEMYRLFFH